MTKQLRIRFRFILFYSMIGFVCFGQSSTKTIEVRGIYGNPKPLWDKGFHLNELGVNAVFVHSGSINKQMVSRAKAEGSKVFAEFATLNGKGYVDSHPEAWAINELGEKVKAATWFMGVCPTEPGFREYRFSQLRDLLLKFDIDGIWMDYMHFHAQFEDSEPILPETCFCELCLDKFSKDANIDLPNTDIAGKAKYILTNHESEWRPWRSKIISGWTNEIKSIITEIKPKALLGLYHCPWNDEEFNGARKRILGLDYELLSKTVDVFSPMVYHQRMGRNPNWVQENIEWFSKKIGSAEGPSPKIWPIVQAHNEPGVITSKAFETVMKGGLSGEATGVMMFTTNAIAEDEGKREVMKRVYLQSAKDQMFIKYARSSFPQLKELLLIPNDAHFPDDIEKNILWCEREFTERGFKTKRLKTQAAPLLLAERAGKNASKTVLVYLQVDGQPVDPMHWFQENPYNAVLKAEATEGGWDEIPWDNLKKSILDPDWRIFARSTSDSKGAVNMFLTAIDMINDEEFLPNYNVKVIMDFEEELGSPNLPKAVKEFTEELAADMLIIFDGPRHSTNRPTLTFGARGIATMTLKIFGPYFPQHSGHYGNYIPNPALKLAQLLASMKDDEGRVVIPDFYDGIEISDEVKVILRSVPDDEKMINYKMGIAASDQVASTYQESLQYPSLNIRGLLAGWVGDEVRTIVPSIATAEIDIRLVRESDPERLIELVTKHITDQGYHVTQDQPTKEERAKFPKLIKIDSEISYLAYRTDFDSKVGIWLDSALKNAFGEDPIKQRTSGGSIPISPFVTELGVPAVGVPTVNRDNNQHSPNENLRIGNYVDGIKTIYYILKEPLK